MSRPDRRRRLGRPARRVRRWARHTPNGEIAVAMMSLGVVLIAAAVIVVLLV